MKSTVTAFGEALWDMLPSGAKLGGAPLNFVYRIQSLGHRGVIVSRLGRDELGERAFEKIAGLGLETGRIQWDESHPTGTVDVTLDEAKTPHFDIVQDVAYDYIEPDGAVKDVVAGSDCLYFGTLIQRAERSRRTLHELADLFEGRYVLVDVNLREDCYSRESVRYSVERADILKLSESEVGYVADTIGIPGDSLPEFARALFRRTPTSVCVVTMGRRGAFAASGEGELVYEPTYDVETVDTTGSGDAFTAGFLHGLLSGRSLIEACHFGNAMGALVAAKEGGTHPVTAEEAEKMIRRGELEEPEPRLEQYRS